MPTPAEILNGLSTIANEMKVLAIVWHFLAAFAVIGLLAGWRPTKKMGASLLTLPLLSVGIFAWAYNNPFNGVVFLAFAVVLFVIALRMPNEKTQKVPAWGLAAGVIMILFGWVYPHFLEGGAWFKYLYAAPMGLIPCPTLSLTIGFALLANGFSSRLWSVVLVFLGSFYAFFGAMRLGVSLDFVLLAGALVLLLETVTLKSPMPIPDDKL